jgi:hypothetical protein
MLHLVIGQTGRRITVKLRNAAALVFTNIKCAPGKTCNRRRNIYDTKDYGILKIKLKVLNALCFATFNIIPKVMLYF